MSLLNYMKMVVSFHDGWDDVSTIHPEVIRTFFLVVMPFSLIPPAMLVLAGNFHAAAYMIDAPASRWEEVSVAFLVTELFTVPLMGWVIKNMAALRAIKCDFKDTFLLAAIAAIPLWLSSLALAVPNLWLMIAAVVLGLLGAASLLYHGTFTILKLTDRDEAQELSSTAFSVGGLVWAMLCVFVVLPLMNT